MKRLCPERFLTRRCILRLGHGGLHTDGEREWLFHDPFVPAWIQRMRASGLPAKDWTFDSEPAA